MSVTDRNKKASQFIVRCKATGLFLSSTTQNCECIAVTYRPDLAAVLDGATAAAAAASMRDIYGSFDWCEVERDAHVLSMPAVPVILQKQAA